MDAPAIHLEHELQLLQEKSMRLSEENALLKDQIYDQNESKSSHLKKIADFEKTLVDQRTNYQQLLQIMVEATEENSELSSQLDKLQKGKKELEDEVDTLKAKMSRVGDDFKKLQDILSQQEATISHIQSKNYQIKSRYTKYKSAFHKLSTKLSNLCPEESIRRKVIDQSISLFEGKTRMEIANCVQEIVENEINNWLRGISCISNINSDELKRLKIECEMLREKYFSREKQFTHILKEARARVLSLQESTKTYQTKINYNEQRIMLLDRENKEMLSRKENEMKDSATKKLSDMEEERNRLQAELDRSNHRVEILTQRIDAMQQLSKTNSEMLDKNENADYCFSSHQQNEITSGANEFQSVTETSEFTSNSINHSVLRTISLNPDTTFVNNSFGRSPMGTLEWVNEDEEKQTEDALKTFNVVAFNGNGCNNSGSVDSNALRRTLKRKMMQLNETLPPAKFECNMCGARCPSLKTLKKHKERSHMRAKGRTVTKVDNSHRGIRGRKIKNYNR